MPEQMTVTTSALSDVKGNGTTPFRKNGSRLAPPLVEPAPRRPVGGGGRDVEATLGAGAASRGPKRRRRLLTVGNSSAGGHCWNSLFQESSCDCAHTAIRRPARDAVTWR